jgi:hypothetical protein
MCTLPHSEQCLIGLTTLIREIGEGGYKSTHEGTLLKEKKDAKL